MSEYMYLCLSDLLDQDPTGQEYFNTLSPRIQRALISEDDVKTFSDLQQRAGELKEKYGS